MSSTVLSSRALSSTVLPRAADVRRTAWPASAWIALLCAGLAVATLAGAALTAPDATARAAADPDLARLLRAMAVIKGVMVALGAGAIGWRFRRPTALPFAVGYVGLVWTAGAAVGAMWQLAAVGRVAVALHAAGALLVVLAWRDRDFMPRSELAHHPDLRRLGGAPSRARRRPAPSRSARARPSPWRARG